MATFREQMNGELLPTLYDCMNFLVAALRMPFFFFNLILWNGIIRQYVKWNAAVSHTDILFIKYKIEKKNCLGRGQPARHSILDALRSVNIFWLVDCLSINALEWNKRLKRSVTQKN